MSYVARDVYAHANPVFVREVAQLKGEAVVLDVGCWNGTLGKVLMQECRGAVVDGIEREASQAQRARDNGYRHVQVVDLDAPLPVGEQAVYDMLLFGDVLEHLVHPERVLAALLPSLKPDGRVLASLPNIGFAVNRITHLLGRWDYKDYGILDRTHLHFYTKRTMVALFENAGLRVTRVEGYVGLHQYPLLVRAPLRFLGRVWPSLFAIQIVLVGEPTTQP